MKMSMDLIISDHEVRIDGLSRQATSNFAAGV